LSDAGGAKSDRAGLRIDGHGSLEQDERLDDVRLRRQVR
jgi:hypothetical protein